jgi:peptidoglycan hydrolase-like protein with peptidoglycan-binding domain
VVGVQSALAARGYYRGAIDGIFGPRTRDAIISYQTDRGFAPTGRIDGTLLRDLR